MAFAKNTSGRPCALVLLPGLAGIRKIKPDLSVARIDTRHVLLQLEPKRAAEEIAAFLVLLLMELVEPVDVAD